MTIGPEQLVDAFSDSVGREKATETIALVADEMGFGRKTAYDVDEALDIAAGVANQEAMSPFVRTAANTVQTRIMAGHI